MAQNTFWHDHWKRRRDVMDRARADGKVLIRQQDSRIQIVAPFRPEFVASAHELGGRWRKRTGVWSFSEASRRLVLQLVKRVYGADALGSWADYIKDDDP